MNDFDKALELLHKTGWCKGVFESYDGRLCLVGALDKVTGLDKVTLDKVTTLNFDVFLNMSDTARALYPERGPSVPKINDHPDTTMEDIELILKHASYEWEQQHHA